MVWFYLEFKESLENDIAVFQSHYGLILSELGEDSVKLLLKKAFNPTMVWFYLFCDRVSARFLTLSFQSHYGLILSCRKQS